MDQELADGRRCVCTHQVAALLREMTSWLKSWKCDAYLLEEQSRQISTRSDLKLKRRSFL